ncbi:ribbon-helix-helix protein, CopG family [Streptomyces sp. WAC08241]|uniref:ribbon-helix-helix protein, CopG family n=1 Tax=unclassified Streptomyces TaxID=2593676 RepID=UPI000F7B425E|nr:ribbon-helix-helix protein, CopG family [Streptomyces sp. WAC08241]RSS40802.1 hypothetical protein EF906_15895 [Streptomyces sp. WAC08241]
MADLDPTVLPPELADPADIEALNDIARQTGRTTAELIREAIHKAVLAHRVWDEPFFEDSHSLPAETAPAESQNSDITLFVGGTGRAFEAKHTGINIEPETRDLLAAARIARRRDRQAWQAMFTRLLHLEPLDTTLIHQLKRQAAARPSPGLDDFVGLWLDAMQQVRHTLETAVHDEHFPFIVVQPEQLDEDDEELIAALLQTAVPTPKGDTP